VIKISAQVSNSSGDHQVVLTTNDREHAIVIPPRANGFGSSANGGELLFLALATCYCNDIYREAARRNVAVRRVQVRVSGEFGDTPGSRAEHITCDAVVEAEADQQTILNLMKHTDTVTEIQNTLRQASEVSLNRLEAVSL
jgi:organic hydroperoxide reductase OsmC/OhrA